MKNLKKEIKYYFKGIYKDRRLTISLAMKDIHRRFAGSYFGSIWVFIQPIIMILLYWFVFQFAFKNQDINGTPYILWFICGMIPWLFISEAIVNASNSFIEYSYLVKKVIFNINILPLVKIISSLFIHLFFVIILLFIYFLFSGSVDIYILQVIYYIFCSVVLSFSIGIIFSSIMVFFRDLSQIISILLLLGMWLTPIAWDLSMFETKYQVMFKLNPVFYIIQGFRDSLINKVYIWERIPITIYFWSLNILLLCFGIYIYSKLKEHFSESL